MTPNANLPPRARWRPVQGDAAVSGNQRDHAAIICDQGLPASIFRSGQLKRNVPIPLERTGPASIASATDDALNGLLRAPIAVAPGDETEHVCLGAIVDHIGRARPCGWHLVLHRAARDAHPGTEAWTHLYRVMPDHGGRVLVLLHRACAGDQREELRREAVRASLGLG